MSYIPASTIKKLWPRATEELRASIYDGDEWFEKTGITSKLALAHFMAQISHECGAGTTMVENLNYRAEALVKQWPTHFNHIQAAQMAHKPQLIANQAYNGRMGNRLNSQDGWNFRGRGGAQTTGRYAYEKLSKHTGLDLLTNPDWVCDPQYFLRIASADFVQCGCLPYALKDDVRNVTKRLNGGVIGLEKRKVWLKQWKDAL